MLVNKRNVFLLEKVITHVVFTLTLETFIDTKESPRNDLYWVRDEDFLVESFNDKAVSSQEIFPPNVEEQVIRT